MIKNFVKYIKHVLILLWEIICDLFKDEDSRVFKCFKCGKETKGLESHKKHLLDECPSGSGCHLDMMFAESMRIE